jgi:hypothetical protein
LAGQDLAALRTRLHAILGELGWDRVLGKQRGGEQSLREHCLAVFDALCACAPFFAAEANPALTPEEFQSMVLAAVAHDAGKAAPAFQAYLRGKATSVAGHVDADRIRAVATHVAGSLALDLRHIEDIVSEAVLHDRHMRRDKGELSEWARPHESGRWRKLADFVNQADSLASTEDVVAAESFLRANPLLLGRARVTCYQVRVRGVSTTFLHDAVLGEFDQAGYRPVLHFAHGAVLAGFGLVPDRAAVAATLHRRIETLFSDRKEDLAELTVGSATSDFLPRPDYVRAEGVAGLLRLASRRARLKAPNPELIATYKRQWTTHGKTDLGGAPGEADIQAILEIGPEACVFKIAKEIFKKVLDDADRALGRELFDAEFGDGSFDRFMQQSTLMPVQDYALCVRGWHRTQHEGHAVGSLDPGRRVALLIDKLERLLQSVLAVRAAPLPSARLIDDWTGQLIRDLALESTPPQREEVELQLAGYRSFKSRSGSKKQPEQQCAQCAGLIAPGEAEEGSAALGNVGSYSNRRMAFAGKGQPPVCRACVVDLELSQLCLGRPVKTMIGLVPRRSLGPEAARELLRRVRALRSTLDRQLSAETADPLAYVALSFPPDALRAESLEAAVVRRVGEDKQKSRPKDLAKALNEKLRDGGLDELNSDHATSFQSVEALAQALIDGTVSKTLREDPDVRGAVESVVGGGHAAFAAITPSLVVLSLDRELGATKDADADRALYAFGLATLFALDLEMACAVGHVSEIRTALDGRSGRTVYVPANGPARRVLGGDWLGLDDAARWLGALRAAIVLRGPASAGSVLEVLRYPSAGYTVRRIEQQTEKPIGPKLWPFVEALKEVLG